MTVSSTAIVFTRYILIEWLRRKKNDEKTICELFYVCCDDIQDMELSTALKQLLEILVNGLGNQKSTNQLVRVPACIYTGFMPRFRVGSLSN